MRNELNQSNYNQLTFFQNQVNTNIEMISSWPHLLIHDSDVASFQAIFLKDKTLNLDGINLVKCIQTKLGLQESSSNWRTGLDIYSPSLERVVSENGAGFYDQKELNRLIKDGWQVSKKKNVRKEPFYYKKGVGTIYNRTANEELSGKLITKLEKMGLHEVDNLTMKIGEESYLVHAVLSQTTGWYKYRFSSLYVHFGD
ncbi:hypothetical protein [Paenibacillus brasilensis]|uniref:hypothetical protein n=1 Tax=Paenibacillus brasilensis TaxID=128574 RepID=UPI003520D153